MLDRNTLGEVVLTAIQMTFPGGLSAFAEAGGVLSLSEFKEDTALIYLPGMTEEYRSVIGSLNTASKFQIAIVDSINFEGLSMHEIAEQLLDVFKDVDAKYQIGTMLYNPLDPLVTRILIPTGDFDKDMIDDIASIFISKIPTLMRGTIMVGSEVHPFSRPAEGTETKPTTAVRVESDRAPITNEVITDLKITLAEECDVLDFINKL